MLFLSNLVQCPFLHKCCTRQKQNAFLACHILFPSRLLCFPLSSNKNIDIWLLSESGQHWGTAHTTNHLMIHQLVVNLVLIKWSNHMGNLHLTKKEPQNYPSSPFKQATETPPQKKRNMSLPPKMGMFASNMVFLWCLLLFPWLFCTLQQVSFDKNQSKHCNKQIPQN